METGFFSEKESQLIYLISCLYGANYYEHWIFEINAGLLMMDVAIKESLIGAVEEAILFEMNLICGGGDNKLISSLFV